MGLSKIIIALGAIWFIYTLAKKPEHIAIFLFTLIVSDINVEMSPLNLRAMVTFLLFARIFMENDNDQPSFFSNGYARHAIFFFVYMVMVSQMNDTLKSEYVKEFLLTCLSAYLGYYYYYKTKSFYYLKQGIIFGGLICFADLAYTYAAVGTFPVIRVHFFFTGQWQAFNHNFFGYICGAAFVFLLADYLNKSTPGKIGLYIMPVMFLGVLLSTSRAAMLAMIIMAIILIGKALSSRKSGKRAYTIVSVTLVCIFISIFLFQILTGIMGIKSDFMETVSARLIDEPIAMFNKMLGNRYDAAKMDSMEWREQASSIAFKYYKSLPFFEQLLGIGYDGFLKRGIGDEGLDAHNGLLLLLIETGILGFVIYYTMIISFWIKVKQLKISSPAFSTIIFIILYVTSHNKEAIQFFAFLVIGSLIAELRYKSDLRKEGIEEEEEVPVLAGQQ